MINFISNNIIVILHFISMLLVIGYVVCGMFVEQIVNEWLVNMFYWWCVNA